MSYQVKRRVERTAVSIRGLKYCVYRWGRPGASPVLLLHGWADTGMSFQFLADALPDDWCLLAPDWRGFGDTDWNPQGYWFPDYLADLDALINVYARDRTVRLVGHSMGGNVVLLYAGVRPDRVTHAVTLEQFGLPDTDPAAAPDRYAQWLDQWRNPPINLEHPNIQPMIERIQRIAPRLSRERAEYLAPYWCKAAGQGKVISKIDPGHKRVNPILYRRAEARACWRRITARTLLVLSDESELGKSYREAGLGEDFRSCFTELREATIPACGHMLHLEQPERTAAVVDKFLREK